MNALQRMRNMKNTRISLQEVSSDIPAWIRRKSIIVRHYGCLRPASQYGVFLDLYLCGKYDTSHGEKICAQLEPKLS
jgi:hypothetical protein